jgi:tetratricopeptide (TPR) repeat protein
MPSLSRSPLLRAPWPAPLRLSAAPRRGPAFLRLIDGGMGRADRFGFRHSSTSAPAIAAFEEAVGGLAAHRPSTSAAIQRALDLDPALPAAHALKGFAQVILARSELAAPARQALADARAALAASGGTSDETALVAALGDAVEGRFRAAAARLDAALEGNPRAFLPVKVAHALRFMIGDIDGMLATTRRVLGHWSEARPGYGYLLGCHAFALEELGQFEAAERIGRRAVALAPDDAWAMHAVSHVHEMQGRTDEGIAWLEDTRPVWSGCNNFAFHMAWHLALFHLEHGEHSLVLALYDREVRPRPTDDFRDVANAVSLLWRLDQEGVAVGERWEELRQIALARRADTTLAFAALHNLLALFSTGEIEAARELRRAMSAKAAAGDGDQAAVMRTVACELADVILDLAGEGACRARLDRLAARLHRLGGSHAQRDVFVRTLAAIAAERGDRDALDRIVAARRRLKRDDRFVTELLARR